MFTTSIFSPILVHNPAVNEEIDFFCPLNGAVTCWQWLTTQTNQPNLHLSTACWQNRKMTKILLSLFPCLLFTLPWSCILSSTPLLSFWSLIVASGSKSQNALWNAITAGIGIKDKDKRGILIDPRSPEEILADDLPSVDSPDAMEKTAIRFGGNHTPLAPLSELVNQCGLISALDRSVFGLHQWLLWKKK